MLFAVRNDKRCYLGYERIDRVTPFASANAFYLLLTRLYHANRAVQKNYAKIFPAGIKRLHYFVFFMEIFVNTLRYYAKVKL